MAPVMAYAAAAVIGAGVVGATLGGIGLVIARTHPRVANALAAGAAVLGGVYGFAALAGYRLRVPSLGLRVPRRWGRYGAWRFALLFGLTLGAGFLTQIPSFAYFVIAMGCVGLKRPLVGVVVMGVFGLTRGATVPLAWGLAWYNRERGNMPRQINATLRALVRRLDWWTSASLCGAAAAWLWTLL